MREISADRLWWGYISTMLHLYAERAASILTAEGIHIASRSEKESSQRGKCFSFSERGSGLEVRGVSFIVIGFGGNESKWYVCRRLV
ncbi:hypothetical protein [Bacteroides heparinolyticus]|uniref:hypothetical protein n=1 Tax=Prevotella heparinolytica TaxID=28113 RepID=UPI003F9F0CBA